MPRLPLLRPFSSSSSHTAQRITSTSINSRRLFHPEGPRTVASAHGTHRFIYRWTIQAIATPFAVAYVCDRIAGRDDSGGDRSVSWDLPYVDTGLLVEPGRIKGQVWGVMKG